MNEMYANTNIFEVPQRKIKSKSPCLICKTIVLNVGFT